MKPFTILEQSDVFEKAKFAYSVLEKRSLKNHFSNNVLLINPVQIPVGFYDSTMHRNHRYFCYPPYGLGVLSAVISSIVSVEIIDLNYSVMSSSVDAPEEIYLLEKDILKKALELHSPSVIGISCMFTLTHDSLKRTCRFLRELNYNGLIVAGGVHISNDPERIEDEIREIDILMPNESEHRFKEFLDLLMGFCDDKHVPNPTSEEKIDTVPDYRGLPIGDYCRHGEVGAYRFLWRPDTVASTVQSNRGCRARCTFCSVRNFNGKGVRSRSIESVIDEISFLVEEHGVNHIMWLDDDLFFSERRAIDLFNSIVKRNLRITWDASNGVIASAVTEQLLSAAKDSGCIGLHIGIESGSDEILKSVRKPSGRKHFLKCGEYLKKVPEIFTKGFLMIGFPHETKEQIEETISLAKEMNLDWYTISLLTPLPSTDIYNQMREAGLIDNQKDTQKTNYGSMQMGTQKRLEKDGRKKATTIISLDDLQYGKQISRSELESLWFEVDYRINYQNILKENDVNKLQKKQIFLTDVNKRMTGRENPLVLYCIGLLNRSLRAADFTEPLHYAQKALTESSIWGARFTKFKILENLGVTQ